MPAAKEGARSAARVFVTRSRKGGALAATAIAVLVIGLWSAPAFARDVRCGDVITEDTKLHEDLLDCPGNGLEIGADGITLDLGGHVIDGTGTGIGIRSHGNDQVQIKDGTIREFSTGVSLGRAPNFPGGAERGPASHNHLLLDLTVRDHVGTAVSLYAGGQNAVERSRLVGNGGPAISLTDTHGNRVVKNKISDNVEGVRLLSGEDNVVLQNRVMRNERVGIAIGLTLGAPFSADNNRIASNTVVANGTDGVLVSTAGTANVVEGNRSHLNGDDGIDVDCWEGQCAPGQATLTRNIANRNGDLGIEADAGVDDGGRNVARGNENPAQCVGVACS